MIESILQPNLIVSVFLVIVCSVIKNLVGEEWKHPWEYDALYKVIRIISEFSISIIPIIGYPLITLISNTGKIVIAAIMMGAIILCEAFIRKKALSLMGDNLKRVWDYIKVFGLVFGLFLLTIGLFFGIYYFAITDILP